MIRPIARNASAPIARKSSTDTGRAENRQRRDRRDLESAQDVLLALLDGADAGAEEAVAEDADHQHVGDDDGDRRAAALGAQHEREEEEEDQRKQVVEEQHLLV